MFCYIQTVFQFITQSCYFVQTVYVYYLYLFYLDTESVVVCLLNKNNISTELHLAANKPRNDVTTFVVTTRSKCKQPLFNFSFQPVVPKVKFY